jgi:hypothetical protein
MKTYSLSCRRLALGKTEKDRVNELQDWTRDYESRKTAVALEEILELLVGVLATTPQIPGPLEFGQLVRNLQTGTPSTFVGSPHPVFRPDRRTKIGREARDCAAAA